MTQWIDFTKRQNLNYFILWILIITCSTILHPQTILAQERKIQPGDAIEIKVFEHDELNQTVVVSADGKVEFPFLRDIPIDGMTLSRFQEVLMAQLSRFLDRRPLITVRFTETYPIKVTVLGQVARPGMYDVANTATLQGAIAAAGGFVPGAQLSAVKLIRETNGAKTTETINLEKFYLEGDPGYLPQLKENDAIMVTGNPLTTSVKVLGNVLRPGSYQTTLRASLLDVIYLAGGPDKGANLSQVKLIKPASNQVKELKIDVHAYISAEKLAEMPLVEPGDIVYIPGKIFSWRQFIDLMRDVLTIASIYIIFRYGRRA